MPPLTTTRLLEPIIQSHLEQWVGEVHRYLDNPADEDDFTRSLLDRPLTEKQVISTLHTLAHMDPAAFKLIRDTHPSPTDPDLSTISARCMAALVSHLLEIVPDRLNDMLRQAAICHHYAEPKELALAIARIVAAYPDYSEAVARAIQEGVPGVSDERLKELTFNNLYQVVQADEDFVMHLLDEDTIHPITAAIATALVVTVLPKLDVETIQGPFGMLEAFYFATLPAQERPLNPQSREALELIWKLIDENPSVPDQWPDQAAAALLTPKLAGLLDRVDAKLQSAKAYLQTLFPANPTRLWDPFHDLIDSFCTDFDINDEDTLLETLARHLDFWNIPTSPAMIRKTLLAPHSAFIVRYLAERMNLTAHFPARCLNIDRVFDQITATHLILFLASFDPPSSRTKAAAFPRWLWSLFTSPVTLSAEEVLFTQQANYTRIAVKRCVTIKDLLISLNALPAQALIPTFAGQYLSWPPSSTSLRLFHTTISYGIGQVLHESPGLGQAFDTALSPEKGTHPEPPMIFHLYNRAIVPLIHMVKSLYKFSGNPIETDCQSFWGEIRQDLLDNGPYPVYSEQTGSHYYFNSVHQAALFSWLMRNPANYAHFEYVSMLIPPLTDRNGDISALILGRSLMLRGYRGIQPAPEEMAEIIMLLRQIQAPAQFKAQARDAIVDDPGRIIPDSHYSHLLDLYDLDVESE